MANSRNLVRVETGVGGNRSSLYLGKHQNLRARSKAPVKAGKEQGVKVPRMVINDDLESAPRKNRLFGFE